MRVLLAIQKNTPDESTAEESEVSEEVIDTLGASTSKRVSRNSALKDEATKQSEKEKQSTDSRRGKVENRAENIVESQCDILCDTDAAIHQTIETHPETDADSGVQRQESRTEKVKESHASNRNFQKYDDSIKIELQNPVGSPKPHLRNKSLFIALAVHNLTKIGIPTNLNNVDAFLCLLFPYYNENRMECKRMVRKQFGSSLVDCNKCTRFNCYSCDKIGKKVCKATIEPQKLEDTVKQLTDNPYVKKSILDVKFLDELVRRIRCEEAIEPTSNWMAPPLNYEMLACLVLNKCDWLDLDQMSMFVKFLFPQMAEPSKIEEFETVIKTTCDSSKYIKQKCPDEDNTYLLSPNYKAEVEEKLMNFALEWMPDMKAALYKPEYIYCLLPRLLSTENRSLLVHQQSASQPTSRRHHLT